jgi:hypothetical protein
LAAVRAQPVGHQHFGCEALLLKQLAHQFHGCSLVVPSLHQEVENLAFVINCSRTRASARRGDSDAETPSSARRCPCCGGRMTLSTHSKARAPRGLHCRVGSGPSPCFRNACSSRLQPRARAGSRCPYRTASPSPSAARADAARTIFRKKARRRHPRRELSRPPAPEVPRALRPPRQNPHKSSPLNQPQPPRGFLPGRLSDADPTSPHHRLGGGRRPCVSREGGVHPGYRIDSVRGDQ